MMFPVYYVVYSVNYLVSLQLTTTTHCIGEYNTYCMLVWNLCLWDRPSDSGAYTI